MANWQSGLFGGGLFGGGEDHISQIPGMYDDYVQHGKEAGDILGGKYGDMSQDPSGFMQKLMEGYKPSAQYQSRLKEGLRTAGATAAAGGMRGTPEDMKRSSGIEDRLMGEDMQQWLGNVLGIQDRGLRGEQGMYDTGYKATGDQATGYGQIQGREDAQQQQQMQMLMQLMKAMGSMP